jgi:hypothetical protein
VATKFTRLTHKIEIQLHLVAESYTICSSRCRRPVRKHLDTPLYLTALKFIYCRYSLLLQKQTKTREQSEIIVLYISLKIRQIIKKFYNQIRGLFKSFRTGRRERELQMVQLSATRCSCIPILWVSLVSFAAITLCVTFQRVLVVVVTIYFVIDSVRKLLDTPS